MLGIGLGELFLVVLLFCVVTYLIRTFGVDPYRNYGLWLLAVFALIYVLERVHLFELLQRISI